MTSQSVHIGVVEAGVSARIASPIVVEVNQVAEISDGPIKVAVDLLKQRTKVLRLTKVRHSEGQRRERWSGGLWKTIIRKQSMSLGSPDVGELRAQRISSHESEKRKGR